MSRLLPLAILSIVPALAACGSLETYRFQYGPAAHPTTHRPAVYFEGQTPNVAMQEIALVEAVGTGTKGDMQDVVQALIDEAYRYGATAIVRVRVECGLGQCHGFGVAVRPVHEPENK